MRNYSRHSEVPHDPQVPASAYAHRSVAVFMLTLTMLIVLGAVAQLNGAGQSSGLSPSSQSRLQAKGTRNGSSEPSASLFLPAVTYASGGYDLSVVVADVNGDGKPDLVVTDYNIGVDVLLGNGDGSFKAPVTYGSGGNGATSVAIADVNGDGRPDLAVTNFYSDSVGVLLGNGDGTFQAAVTYSTAVSGGFNPDSVAITDVNGDGRPDLLVTNSSGGNFLSKQVCVLLGNGDGTFQAAVGYSSGGEIPKSIAVADVNGDGRPDLLVANFWASFQDTGHGSLGVLLGNGDGTFQSPVPYRTGGAWTVSVTVGDVNGDGKPDLMAGNSNQSTLGVLLGNGDGTFQTAVTYSLGGLAGGSIAIADVNGDGKPDLVAASCGSSTCDSAVGVLLGNGDGTFQPVVLYSSGGYGAAWAAVADVNRDTKPDLLVATCANSSCSLGEVGVLINNVHSPTATSLTSSLNPSIYGQKVTWTATVATTGSITPTGKVLFTWSVYTIGSATLNSSGVATLTKSNLNADAFPLTGVYVGDANNLGSTSAVLNQVVLQTTSTATLTSSPNPSMLGQAVTFTATISSPTVLPRGSVTFTTGKSVLGTAQLVGGKAKLTISSLSVGSTKVTAIYYGDSDIAESSASVVQTVQ